MKISRGAFVWYLAIVLLSPAAMSQKAGGRDEIILYVGTYTGQQSKGIYAWRFQPSTGTAASIGLAAETDNPSFLAIHPNRRFLYAVNEVSTYGRLKTGSISAFSIDYSTGGLKLLNKVSTEGPGPCHVALDRTGNWAMVANYNGGSVAVFPVKADGSLGEASAFVQHRGSSVHPRRQQGPHAHSINPSPDNRFALVADLGLDQVLSYQIDAGRGILIPNKPPFVKLPGGSGPRHLVFHPGGPYAYVINELTSSLTTFAYDSISGQLRELQNVSLLPKGFTGNSSAAEVAIDKNGRFLYASNRGLDNITVFAIDARSGTLTRVEQVPTQGKNPRHFGIDPTGAYLFAENQDSENIVVFRIDPGTGKLSPTGTVLKVSMPVCAVFLAEK